MKEVPENELLSAHLDGELTAEEQAEVEKLLAASPAARQLADELRALSSSLQALPTYQIGEDISEQVLRLAEQGRLDQRAAAEQPKGAVEQPDVPVWRAMVRRFTRPQSLVWAGVAVAAALLLMVTQSDRLFGPGGREIAMDTAVEDAPAAASRAAPTMKAGEEADAETAADYPSEAEAAPLAMERGRGDFMPGKAGPRDAASTPMPAARAPATPPAPQAAFESVVAEPTEAPAVVPPAERGLGGMGIGGGFGVAKESDALKVQRPSRPDKDQPAIVSEKAEAGTGVVREEPLPGKGDQPQPDAQRPQPVLVVSCWATPAALRERAFERLLEEQSIRRVDTAGTEAEGAPVPASVSQFGPVESYADQAGPPGWRQVVDVEATRDQLEALLLGVQGQSDQFAFSDAARGIELVGVNGRRSRATLDRARAYQEVEPAAETAAEPVQRKLGRMEVDKVLDLLERREADDDLRRKVGIGVLVDEQLPPADLALPIEGAPGYGAPQMQRAQQEREAEARPPGRYGIRIAAPAGPEAPRASAAAREPAPAAEVPLASEVVAPEKAAPKPTSEAMEIQAEQPESDEEVRLANEPPGERGADRAAPKLAEKPGPLAEPKKAKQPGPVVPTEEPDRYARTYRVRFVFHVVDGPGNVAASIAQEAAAARMVEEPPMALDACEEPSAAAPPPAQEQP